MRVAVLLLAVVLTIALGLVALRTSRGTGTRTVTEGVVAVVSDGDTLRLGDGRRVRLLQVDAPELAEGECYAREAQDELRRLAPPGTQVRLETDPELDSTDRFGRELRYVAREAVNVNLELVRLGAATPYFFRGERGRLADALLGAAAEARAARRGLWGRCPAARLDPERQVDSGP